jgi:hypothetical protein
VHSSIFCLIKPDSVRASSDLSAPIFCVIPIGSFQPLRQLMRQLYFLFYFLVVSRSLRTVPMLP